jgi:serine/threonine protein kinase
MTDAKTCTKCGKPNPETEASLCRDCDEGTKKATSVLTADEEIKRAKAVLFEDVEVSHTPTPAPRPVTKLGAALANRYELIKSLETTLFSEVFLVQDKELGRHVVIKYLNLSTRFEHVERFKREAQLLANFKHPNIVRVYDSGVDEGKLYIVMEYIEGLALDTFNARLVQMGNEDRRIRRMCEIIHEVCFALEYLHAQGIVHRDIKPANILLDRLGKPYLIDFGIARRVSGKEMVTVDGELLGTVAYMSPEQASGTPTDIDRRTDIYSVGVMLYHLLTGQLPFGGANYDEVLDQIRSVTPQMPSHLNPSIPAELEKILLKTLAKDKNERYQTAKDLARDLEQISKPKPPPPPPKRTQLYSQYKIHIAVALNVLAFGLVLWSVFGPDAAGPGDTPLPPPVEDLTTAKVFLRGTFQRGEMGAFLVAGEGEVAVDQNHLVLRSGTVRTRAPYSSTCNFRLVIDCTSDAQSPPNEIRLSFFVNGTQGYSVGWNAKGQGWVNLDDERKFIFSIPPSDGKTHRFTLLKKGSALTVQQDGKVLIDLPSVFTQVRTGVLEIASSGGTLKVGSLLALMW